MPNNPTPRTTTAGDYPFRFNSGACAACAGRCCRGAPGHVWVDPDELSRIATHLNQPVLTIRRDYARQVNGRWSLRERPLAADDFACIFFDLGRSRCTIYPVRPRQCATYPFWHRFRHDPRTAAAECPGVEIL